MTARLDDQMRVVSLQRILDEAEGPALGADGEAPLDRTHDRLRTKRAQGRHVPGAGRGKHCRLLSVGLGFVDVSDAVAGHAALDQLTFQLAIGRPALILRGAEVEEDEQEGTRHR